MRLFSMNISRLEHVARAVLSDGQCGAAALDQPCVRWRMDGDGQSRTPASANCRPRDTAFENFWSERPGFSGISVAVGLKNPDDPRGGLGRLRKRNRVAFVRASTDGTSVCGRVLLAVNEEQVR
jgi:hypothetical protein